MENNNSNRSVTWGEILIKFAITGFLLIVIVLFVTCSKSENENSKDNKDRLYSRCYTYSQTLVKDKLKSPKSAKFPWYDESFISDKGDTIVVSAYVDADNSFGANIRVKYIATINVKDGEPHNGTVTLLE